jgi:hypothetical protein
MGDIVKVDFVLPERVTVYGKKRTSPSVVPFDRAKAAEVAAEYEKTKRNEEVMAAAVIARFELRRFFLKCREGDERAYAIRLITAELERMKSSVGTE